MAYYLVTGFQKQFKTMEEAELFRLNKQKERGYRDLKVIRVVKLCPGQMELGLYGPGSKERKRIPA